jgi:hypothetical protein
MKFLILGLTGLLILFAYAWLTPDAPRALISDRNVPAQLIPSHDIEPLADLGVGFTREKLPSPSASQNEASALRKEVYVSFVDSFGVAFRNPEEIETYWSTKEGGISMSYQESSHLWRFQFNLPQKNMLWRPLITCKVRNKGDTSLEAIVDMSSISSSSSAPAEIQLLPNGLWDNLLSGQIVDELGNPIQSAEIHLVEDIKDVDSFVEERAVSASTGGFWLSYDEIGVHGGLRVMCRGYLKQEFKLPLLNTTAKIVMKKGAPVEGHVQFPVGIHGGVIVFKAKDETHTAELGPSGAFRIFGISEGSWRVQVLRNGLNFYIPESIRIGLRQGLLDFDLRSETKALQFQVEDKAGKLVSNAELAVFPPGGKGTAQRIALDKWQEVLLPKGMNHGLIVASGFRDTYLDFVEGKQRVQLLDSIPVSFTLVLPDWFSNEIKLNWVAAMELEAVDSHQRFFDLEIEGNKCAGEVAHEGPYKVVSSFIYPGMPFNKTAFTFVMPVNGNDRIEVPVNGVRNFQLSPEPQWLIWVEEFFNVNSGDEGSGD